MAKPIAGSDNDKKTRKDQSAWKGSLGYELSRFPWFLRSVLLSLALKLKVGLAPQPVDRDEIFNLSAPAAYQP